MGLGVSIVVVAVGFILALAVHPAEPHAVNVNMVGWILVVVGLLGFIADLLLWESWGPRYLRRTNVAQRPAGYGTYPVRRGYRRHVVEEEDAGPPGPGY